MSLLKAIIFDMDGVLLLSTSVHEHAYKKSLQEVGITDICYNRFAGMRTDEAMKIILAEKNIKASSEMISRLTKRKRVLSSAMLKEDVPLVYGCKELLISLKRKFKLALVSSASVGTVDIFLDSSESRQLFDVIINGEDVTRAKPDSAIYLLSLSKLGLNAKECLVVEDALNGVISAKEAGIKVCGILGGESKENLLKAGASMVLENVNGLLDELGIVK